MSDLHFEWDRRKAAANERKHRVTFEGAMFAFYDEEALLVADPDYSGDDSRFVLLGLDPRVGLVSVCHTYVEEEGTIRIISARKATRREQSDYVERARK